MTVFTLMAPVGELPLLSGTRLVLEAISPTTGAAITGATVSQVVIYGSQPSISDLVLDDSLPSWVPDGDQEVV